ncbi:MAG: hypothetical protein GWP06_17300, partial [Actinobacteria bacterium]|nr:hypothetical protein [Actinomycetota bacterium]
MKKIFLAVLMISFIVILIGCGPNAEEKELQTFINTHLEKIKPLSKNANLAYWKAANTGNSEDYDKYSELELEMRKIYSDTSDFQVLKKFKASGNIKDHLLARQLDMLY